MTEIFQKNFNENYDQIMNDLRSSTFISVDCEFSGLFLDEPSLFDTPEKRYEKLRNNLLKNDFRIIQFGFTTFCYNRIENNFLTSSYSFYLMPASVFQKKKQFLCQIDSIEFLCRCNFNFNKLFYDGINYVNEFEENNFLQMLKDENFLSWEEEKIIKNYCSKISKWAASSEENEFLIDISNEKDYFIYLLHLIIRKKFLNVWTFYDEPYNIKVKKIKESEKFELLANKKEQGILKEKLYKSILGFTNIMKEIKNLKKPIVGHNFYLDLLIIYNQFYGTLPGSYKKFKKEITKVFPQIYDTKHMSYHLRNLLQKENKWTSNTLKDLFAYFSQGKGSVIVLSPPLIVPKNKDNLKSKTFHDAGFDSFCTGFCFVKMANIYSMCNKSNNSFFTNIIPITSSSLLKAIEFLKNRINFPRSQLNFIILDGSDQIIEKSCFLLIKAKKSQTLDILKIQNEVAKYSSVDILPQNQHTAIMAVRNHWQINEILNHFKNSQEFYITRHNFVKFKFLEKGIMYSIITATLGLLFYNCFRRF